MNQIFRFFSVLLVVYCSSETAAVKLQPNGQNEITVKNGIARIVGGIFAPKGTYPYAGVIVYSDGVVHCGATLIDRSVAMTAAHCLSPKIMGSLTPVKIHFKTTSLNPLDSTTITAMVSNYTYHNQFNSTVYTNDIGLLFLNTNITTMRVVNLPKSFSPLIYDGLSATAVGFGATLQVLYPNNATVSNAPLSNRQRQVYLSVLTNSDCSINYGYPSVSSMFCATSNFQSSTCRGDDGGPLFAGAPRVQIGITIGSYGCADPRYPSVYTKVSNFIDWINTTKKRYLSG